MKKYNVYGIYTVSKFIGTFEAESAEAAKELAEDSDDCEGMLSVCHQCADTLGDDPQLSSMEAMEAEADR